MAYNKHRTQYVSAYYKGINTLPEKEKQEFLNSLKSYNINTQADDEILNEHFKTWVLSNELKNSSDEELNSLITDPVKRQKTFSTAEDRDKAFAQLAMSSDLDGVSDAVDNPEGFLDKAWRLVKAAGLGIVAAESNNPDVIIDFANNSTEEIRNFQTQLNAEQSHSIRQQAREHTNQMMRNNENRIREMYYSLPEYKKNQQRAWMESVSRQLSPNYFGYYVGKTDDETLDKLSVQYMLMAEYGGEQMANEYIQHYWQNDVARKQTEWEKAGNATVMFWNDMVGTIGMVGGFVYGLTGIESLVTGESYVDNILNNSVSRWANDVVQTGVIFDTDLQNQLKAIGVNENGILNTVQQEKDIFTANTIYELFGQYGFTAAATLASLGTSSLITGGTKLATGAIAQTTFGTTKFGLMTMNAMNKAGKIANMAVPFIVGTGEAGIEALTAYDESIKAGKDQIQASIAAQIDKEIEQYVQEHPDLVNYNLKNYKGLEDYDSTFGTIPADSGVNKNSKLPIKRNYSETDIANMALLLKQHPDFRKEYEEKYKEYEVESLKALEDQQKSNMWTTFWLNAAVTGSLNCTLQISQMAPGVRRAFTNRGTDAVNVLDFISTSPKQWSAAAKKYTWKNLTATHLKRSLGEGAQEWAQALVSAYDEGKALNVVDQYFQRRFDADTALDAFVVDQEQLISAGLKRVGEEALSQQTLKEGIYGALSTFLGGPNANMNAKFGSRQAGESRFSHLRRNMPIAWDGIFSPYNSQVIKNENQRRQNVADFVNAFFSEEQNLNTVFSVVEMLGATKAYNDSILLGNEKEARDSKLDILFSTAAMVNALQGTGFHAAVMDTLKERSKLNEANISVEGSKEKSVIEEYRNVSRDFSSTDEEVISTVRQSAQDMLSMMKSAKHEISNIANTFGSNISLDIQNALVINRLHRKDAEKRIKALKGELNSINFTEEEQQSSNHSTDIKRGYARFGNKTQAINHKAVLETEISDVKKQIAELEEQKKEMPTEMHGIQDAVIASNKYFLDSKQEEKEKVNKYIQLVSKLDEAEADNIVLSMNDIANLDSESRSALLDNGREHIIVEEAKKNGRIRRKKVLNKEKRQLSNKQWREIEKFNSRGEAVYSDFRQKVKDLYELEKDLESYMHTEAYYLKNPNALLKLSAAYQEKAKEILSKKKYNYLLDDKEIPNYDTFRQKVLEALTSAENSTEKKIIRSTINDSKYGKQFKQDYGIHLELLKEIKKTPVYIKLSDERKQELIALFDTAFYKGHVINVNKTSANEVGNIVASITKEEVENTLNRKNKVENSTIDNFTELGFSAVQSFVQARKESTKAEERKKPTEVKKTTPENNTPHRSEGPVFESPVVETSKSNPTIVLSEESLINLGATPAMMKFYKDNDILANITRLIAEGKLHSKSKIHKEATQVYFTVERIGHYYEVIQLVEDADGKYTVEGKKYSVIGIETNATSFTKEDKKEENVKKLLSKTASITKVDTQRVTGESSNLKDIAPGDEDSVLKKLTVAGRTTSSGDKKEMVYSSRTGRGGTVYTSSVSDTPIDQVKLTEDKTAIDLLFEYKNLPIEERSQKAAELLKHLDYSKNNYYYNQVIELIESIKGKDKLSDKDITTLNTNINNIFKQLYFLGQASDKSLTQFVFKSQDNSLSLQIQNAGTKLKTQERDILLSELTQESFLEMFVSTLAEATVDDNGKPKKFSKERYVLSFEIGLQDLELINNPLALRGLSKADAEAVTRRINGKKGFLKDKIAIGALQLTNNQAELSPKSIKLSFNYDGKTTLDSQIIPEANSDTTESRSNTVETTTGEVIDGDTGVTITPASNEVKITDEVEKEVTSTSNLKENESQPIDSTIDIDNPLGISTSESETVVEEDEEEISMNDIREQMIEDDEFGNLYDLDKQNSSTQSLRINKEAALKYLSVNKYLAQFPSLSREEITQIINDLIDSINSGPEGTLYQESAEINEYLETATGPEREIIIAKVTREILIDLADKFLNVPIQKNPTKIIHAKSLSHEEYKELFDFYNTNPARATLFNLVFDTAKQLNIQFNIVAEGKNFKYPGSYNPYKGQYGVLKISATYFNSSFVDNSYKAATLLHELIHAVTSKAIKLVQKELVIVGVQPTEALIKAVRELEQIYTELKDKDVIKNEYGMTNIREMIAELANPRFLSKLYKAQPLWKKFIDKLCAILVKLYNNITNKKVRVKSMTSKALRKNLETIMKESLKIGSLTGATISQQTDHDHQVQLERREQVNSLQHSNNALTESWDWMSDKMQESLTKRGLSQEVWEQLTPEEKEKAIECR